VTGTLAFAPAPAHAATSPTTATYQCAGTGTLAGVSVPLTLSLQSLTDGLTTGTPLQPVLHSAVGQVGSVLTQLLAVVDGVLGVVLNPVLDLLNQLTGTLFGGSTTLTATVANLEFQLVNSLGTVVSSTGASLSQTLTLSQLNSLGQNNPLNLVVQNLGSGLSTSTAGTYSVTAPASFDLSVLSSGVGSTVQHLGCTISTLGGAVATVIDDRVVLGPTVVVKPPVTSGPKTTPTTNPCTAALPKVGTKRTALKLKVSPKKVRTTRHAKLTVTGTYKAAGKRKKAKGVLLVCDGTKALGYTSLSHGRQKIALPKLAAGKHRLLVRFLGGGKAKPANKRIVLKVRR
jgi:hypothetical protein